MSHATQQRRRVAVLGAQGGIGKALVDALAARPDIETVYALTRTPTAVTESDTIIALGADYDAPETLATAAERIREAGELHLAIVATGLLHSGDQVQPEKDWRHIDPDMMARVFAINTIGPSLAAQSFLPLMPKTGRSAFAVLGARVGSISDNEIGGWYSYRASKAALAMIVRSLSIELKRKRRETVCVALHPGTVDTGLSEPFQSNTKPGQVVPPSEAAANILRVIDGLSPNDSGGHFAWDGSAIPA